MDSSQGLWDIFSSRFTKLHLLLMLRSSFGKQQKSSSVQKTQRPVSHTGCAVYVGDGVFHRGSASGIALFKTKPSGLACLRWPVGITSLAPLAGAELTNACFPPLSGSFP